MLFYVPIMNRFLSNKLPPAQVKSSDHYMVIHVSSLFSLCTIDQFSPLKIFPLPCKEYVPNFVIESQMTSIMCGPILMVKK